MKYHYIWFLDSIA